MGRRPRSPAPPAARLSRGSGRSAPSLTLSCRHLPRDLDKERRPSFLMRGHGCCQPYPRAGLAPCGADVACRRLRRRARIFSPRPRLHREHDRELRAAGVALADRDWSKAIDYVETIAAFIVGALAAAIVKRLVGRGFVVLLLVAAILVVLCIVDPGVRLSLVALAFAMGLQGGSLARFRGQRVQT